MADGSEQGKQSNSSFKYCPHCSQLLGRTTFYRHKSLYFKSGKWSKAERPSRDELSNENDYEAFQRIEDSEFLDPFERENEDEFDDDCDSQAVDDDVNTGTEIWVEENDPYQDFDKREDGEKAQSVNHIITVFLHLIFAWQMTFSISDNCVESLLKIVFHFLTMINFTSGFSGLCELADNFPATLFKARRYIGHDKDDFLKIISCSKCHKLYTYEQAVVTEGDKTISRTCNHVRFPNHPQQRMREECGNALMKTVVSADGKKSYLYPLKTYCYQPLKTSLQRILKRTDVREAMLKKPQFNTDGFFDIHDGRLWKEFKDVNGNGYFSDKRNLAGILNIDWFQPFERHEHSLGVIYIAILNLPREIRFKKENILLVGIIPGPKEPDLTVNSYLQPLVNDLLSFWKGENLHEGEKLALYRFALLCIASDLPATRKCCGFLSYNAEKGCSKCWKTFPREAFGEKPDFSGFDVDEWVERSGEEHKALAKRLLQAKTKTEKSKLESASGVRYSELFRLPYFDPIAAHVVDPMHNLLLGTAKHAFNVWVETGVLDKKKISEIDALMSKVGRKSELGRTSKSMSLSNTMKADEWKNWVLVFSLYCLKDTLPASHFNLWQIFVRACALLLKPYMKHAELENAHQLLLLYCRKFQETYGRKYCTPNMHLHLHLKKCIENYGPVYGFWAFSFERYNGILGSYHTNNRSLTITLMRKFIDGIRVVSSYQQLEGQGLPALDEFRLMNKIPESMYLPLLYIRGKDIIKEEDLWKVVYTLITVPKLACLPDADSQSVSLVLNDLFLHKNVTLQTKFIKSYERIKLGSEVIGTARYRNGASSDQYLFARLHYSINSLQPAIVKDIIEISLKIDNEKEGNLIFLKIGLLEKHQKEKLYGERCPMTVWSIIEKEERFIPISFIHKKASFTKGRVSFDSFIVENMKRSKIRSSDIVYFVL